MRDRFGREKRLKSEVLALFSSLKALNPSWNHHGHILNGLKYRLLATDQVLIKGTNDDCSPFPIGCLSMLGKAWFRRQQFSLSFWIYSQHLVQIKFLTPSTKNNIRTKPIVHEFKRIRACTMRTSLDGMPLKTIFDLLWLPLVMSYLLYCDNTGDTTWPKIWLWREGTSGEVFHLFNEELSF